MATITHDNNDVASDAELPKAPQLPENYYELFEVDSNATVPVIRQAYRRLCLQWHPDRHQDAAIAAKAFHHIQTAYVTLSNPQLRQQYNQHGHHHTARAAATAQPIDTGNELFQVEREAATYQASLSLLQRLPVLEQQFQLETGSLELEVAGSHLAACDPLDATCVLSVVDSQLDQGGLNACLCTTHARLHQCNRHCTSKQVYCRLFAKCIHRHWLVDVQSAWSVQVSEPSDPERPAHPYWFNPKIGMSVWKADDEASPPDVTTQPHTCTAGQCTFQHLLGRLWVCRLSCAQHVCTPTQCQQRLPLEKQSHDNTDSFDSYCWVTGQIYAGGEHSDRQLDGLTAAESAALAAAEQLDPGCGSSGSEARLIVSRQGQGAARRHRGERKDNQAMHQSLQSPRETSSHTSPSHSTGDASPTHESSLAYIEELAMSKRAQARDHQEQEQRRIEQLKADRQDDGSPVLGEEEGDNWSTSWDNADNNDVKPNIAKRSAAMAESDAHCPSKRAKRTDHSVVWVEDQPQTSRSSIKRLQMSLLAEDMCRLHNLVAPPPERRREGKEAESFYGEYVTAVLDQPDHDKAQVGDYDTMEALGGGGREVVEEEAEDELLLQGAAELEEDRLRSIQQLETQCIEWTTDPTLGKDGGQNAHGGALRVYDGRVFQLVQEQPPAPRTRPQALRAGLFELADTTTRFSPRLPNQPSS
eukprot:m.202895 g.202895  ORF g.202895 m.202895 type:complete len:699 (+) comp17066_c0_seq7:1963-4059(+)